MPCPDYGIIGENLTFTIQAKNGAGTPTDLDADAKPTYSVYEEETGTAIATGTMAKLNDAGTTGFYSETLALTTAAGYELYKTYTIRTKGTVESIAIVKAFSFYVVGSTIVPTATSGALTTYAKVKQYLGLSNDDDQDLIEALITRATSQIQNHTGRTLISTTFRERYDSIGQENEVILRESPIISVNYVSISTEDALSITNTSSDAYRAAVSVEDSTLTAPTMTLEVFGGANDGSNSLTLSSLSAQTVTGLVTDINALGGGWAAVAGVAPLWDPIEILPMGNRQCLNNLIYAQIPTEPEWNYKTYSDQGVLALEFNVTKGDLIVIVKYTAGYATTPADLEQICIEQTKVLYDSSKKDAAVKSEKLGDYSYTLADESRMTNLSSSFQRRLAPYMKAERYAY